MIIKFRISRLSRLLLIVSILLICHNCIAQSVVVQKADDYIAGFMKQDTIPGMAVAVLKNNNVVYKRYKGFANLEHLLAIDKNSVFQIASVSKQFTAAAIMLLVEQGKINLHANVSDYLPDAPEEWNAVTISTLLAHCSGLINYEDIKGFAEKAYLDSAHAVVVKSTLHALYQQKLRFSPGTKSEYCNSNYFVLGVVIEKVTGEDFEHFLVSRILGPLQMQQTQINDMSHIIKHRVAGYTITNHRLINADRLGMAWFFAEGNIVTTMDDLLKWVQVTETNKLMKQSSIREMSTPYQLQDGTAGRFGYGWFIDAETRSITYHSGHTPGFSAFVYRNALKKLKVILLLNNDNVPTQQLLEMAKAIDQKL